MPHHSRMGRSSSICPGNDVRQDCTERLPGATWIALPGVGHNAMVDDPGLVARTILAVTGVGV
jgi:pimeloyl-ACP methyl ester carboxylesterase